MQKDNCKEPLHNHHDGCPSCYNVDVEYLQRLVKSLQHRCSQYSRLSAQHVRNLQKKQDEIWKLKAELAEAEKLEKFNKMQS